MDLEAITVDDVMTPRNRIHALDLEEKPTLLRQQLATSYHSRVPVYEGSIDKLVGVLPLKSVVNLQLSSGEVTAERLRPLLRPPYFIPAGTPLLTQLTQFQSDRQRLGLVVDEYGELLGLVTIEDIVEEIIGEFTTQAPGGQEIFRREPDGSVIASGMALLRTLNRRLGTQFPLDGPKTLNGLILEHLGDIPEAGATFPLQGQMVEILQTQDRAVKVVKLLPPVGRGAAPLQTPVERASSAG
jgi:Mg2+/Co2+ transporter CorB